MGISSAYPVGSDSDTANLAVALSAIRGDYVAESKLPDNEKVERRAREDAERERLARDEGSVCFDLFARYTGEILRGSARMRKPSQPCTRSLFSTSSRTQMPVSGVSCMRWAITSHYTLLLIPNRGSTTGLAPILNA